jgi:hypothetical protein
MALHRRAFCLNVPVPPFRLIEREALMNDRSITREIEFAISQSVKRHLAPEVASDFLRRYFVMPKTRP